MTDKYGAEAMAQKKFETDMGLHGRWADGLWDQLPLANRLALTNNMASFISALSASGLAIRAIDVESLNAKDS